MQFSTWFKNCNSSPRVGAGGPGQPPPPRVWPVVQTARAGARCTPGPECNCTLLASVSAGVTNSQHRHGQAGAAQPAAAQSCEFSAKPGVSDLAVCRLCAKLRPSPPGPRGDIGVVTPWQGRIAAVSSVSDIKISKFISTQEYHVTCDTHQMQVEPKKSVI